MEPTIAIRRRGGAAGTAKRMDDVARLDFNVPAWEVFGFLSSIVVAWLVAEWMMRLSSQQTARMGLTARPASRRRREARTAADR